MTKVSTTSLRFLQKKSSNCGSVSFLQRKNQARGYLIPVVEMRILFCEANCNCESVSPPFHLKCSAFVAIVLSITFVSFLFVHISIVETRNHKAVSILVAYSLYYKKEKKQVKHKKVFYFLFCIRKFVPLLFRFIYVPSAHYESLFHFCFFLIWVPSLHYKSLLRFCFVSFLEPSFHLKEETLQS